MPYAVRFDMNRIAGPYQSIAEILGLPCFPQPIRLENPEDWEEVPHPPVTKPVCAAPQQTGLTGRIVQRIEG